MTTEEELTQEYLENLLLKELKELEKTTDYEKTKYDNFQKVAKVILNSAYGAVGNQHFLWYDLRQAEAITLSGQLTIQWAEKKVNEYVNKILGTSGEDYVIYCDTDSLYVNMDKVIRLLVDDEKVDEREDLETIQYVVDKVDLVSKERFEKKLDQIFEELYEYLNADKPRMRMKREAIASGVLMQSKKHYAMNIWDDEGTRFTREPKLKIVGIEAVKSSTPAVCREKIKEAIKIILSKSEQELIDFNEEFRAEFKKLPFVDIATPSSVNGIEKWTENDGLPKSGAPIHVRGAIVYNKTLKKHGLDKHIDKIHSGEKIKYIYLKTPNPVEDSHVISFVDHIPKEFDLEEYIDYNKQFEKTYLNIVKSLADIIGYDHKKVDGLNQFFF